MSRVRVGPAAARGTVVAPPSKSYTHRFLLAAHLSGRPFRVHRPLTSDDTIRTARAVGQLGSRVSRRPGVWSVAPGPARSRRASRVVDCGESGTSLRLLVAAAALQPQRYRFVGRGRLPERPMRPLLDALRSLGATVRPAGAATVLPLDVRGPIHGGRVRLEVGESSQFTSALLFALPLVRPASTVETVGDAVSEPYVRASRAVLRRCGIRVRRFRSDYRIPGGQSYSGDEGTVPGDASSAAYLWAAAAVSGGTVKVRGVPPDWPQADLAVLPLLRRYGAIVRRSGDSVSVAGGERRPFRVELTGSPDLYPLAGVLAATAPGRSQLLGATHAAAKESDRREGTARLARSLGARVSASPGELIIDGVARPRSFRAVGLSDHRLVMSAAVAALATDGPCEVADASCVGKSFPGFFDALAAIGGDVIRR